MAVEILRALVSVLAAFVMEMLAASVSVSVVVVVSGSKAAVVRLGDTSFADSRSAMWLEGSAVAVDM